MTAALRPTASAPVGTGAPLGRGGFSAAREDNKEASDKMMSERDYMRGGGYGGGRYPWSDWSAVKTLVVVNVAVFVLQQLLGNGFTQFLALSAPGVWHLELWRPLTYMFAHAGLSHILFNMWSLWVFGGMVERVLGKARLVQLYVFSGLIGALWWLLANWGSPALCVGASGSVFGVMAAAAMAFPNARMQLLFPPVEMRLRTLALCLALLEVVSEMADKGSNVAHLAHIGGMVGAFIFMRRLVPGFGDGVLSRLTRGWRRPRSTKKDSRLGRLDPREVDRVLDKLATSGRSSLTPEEQATLAEASRRLRGGTDDSE